ncbi:MAG TPA: cytochrome c [Casimicrobiaceae bacterium]|nr:cytochrome c [Casimicrobiaceae bacterium]
MSFVRIDCMRATVVAIGIAVTTSALALKIELPAETGSFKPGAGSELAQQQCVACHSADYVSIQPPGKPLAFWKAEVEKMKKVYGAQIPDDQIEPIARYLARAYGDGG